VFFVLISISFLF